MKILLHSNSPRSGTGYGVQIAMIATQLAADGHDIAVSCTHGHDAGMGVWKSPKGDEIRLYPRRFSPTGDDILHGHANHFFEGDLDAGWVIPLIDVWALRSPYLAEYNMAAWAPVDHVDVPPGVLGFFDDTKAVPLAMSRHGETGYLRHGLDPTYIPLAVDTSVFKPTFEVVINGEAIGSRDLLNIPRNAFVVGVVAMNKGNAFDRKGFSEIMYSFGKFHANHPNAVLYMHTDKMGAEGIHLMALAADAGVPQSALIFSDQYAYTIGFSSEMMAALYTSFDVLLSPSHAEGACVPLLESQACGTPVIASNATAQPEHVGIGSGWLVAGQRTWDPSQHSPAYSLCRSAARCACRSSNSSCKLILTPPNHQ